MKTIETLKNSTVTLRRYSESDIELLYEKLGKDPEMARYTGWNPYSTMESCSEFVHEIVSGYESDSDAYGWIIEADNIPVGEIGAYGYLTEDRSIEIGYSIFREFWGKGYATEALSLVLDFLKDIREIETVRAWTATDNQKSERVLLKNGFEKTEIKDKALKVDLNTFDQAIFRKSNKQ